MVWVHILPNAVRRNELSPCAECRYDKTVYGTHPKIVQDRLGYSDNSMTLNRYSDVIETMQRDVAHRLAAAIGA